MKKPGKVSIILSIFLLILIFLSICLGSVKIKLGDVISSVFNSPEVQSTTGYIIKNMRLPRTFTAVLSGAILALSGLTFQCIFRNPMADSYILGISSGASCFVALAFALGLNISDSNLIPLFAFTGSVLTSVFLMLSNRKDHFGLLLTGIAMNFLLSAVTTLFVYLGKRQLDAIMFWTMGSFANSNWTKVWVMCIGLLIYTVFMFRQSQAMDILLLDDSTAISSGLNIQKERTLLLITSSIMTALVVSYCGVIGFVGLMSPHIARLLIGPKHKSLIPLSMLFGSIILTLSDLISRTLISPSELPVGIITSIIGAPLFFVILKRRKSWIK